jgi:hypothetical protein
VGTHAGRDLPACLHPSIPAVAQRTAAVRPTCRCVLPIVNTHHSAVPSSPRSESPYSAGRAPFSALPMWPCHCLPAARNSAQDGAAVTGRANQSHLLASNQGLHQGGVVVGCRVTGMSRHVRHAQGGLCAHAARGDKGQWPGSAVNTASSWRAVT